MPSDDFWKWLKDYRANSTVPLQFRIAPNGGNNHVVTPGAPNGCFNLTRREWNKVNKECDTIEP